MNTQFALLAHYETTTIPLKDVCEKFFWREKEHRRTASQSRHIPCAHFQTARQRAQPHADSRQRFSRIHRRAL